MIAAMFMGSTILSPLYTLYEQVFGLSRIASTLLYAVYVVGNCTALLFFGRLADQVGRRRVALPAIFVSVVGAFMFLVADHSVWLFIARALTGFGVGVAAGVGAAWIAELDPNRDRTRAALIAVISNFLGIALGPLIAGVLAQYSTAPLRWPF